MPRRLPTILLSTLLAGSLAAPALAQSRLERMEVISEQASVLVNEALVAEMPALEGNLPDPAWDDEMRGAFSCVLDGYLAQSTGAEVDAMMDRMETALATATPDMMMSGGLDAQVGLPAGIDQDESMALMSTCGVMAIMMERMAASGAMQIMMDP